MDAAARKCVLRMIPYAMHVVTTAGREGVNVAAATVNWVTQISFTPPLLAVALPAGSEICAAVRGNGRFALHMLGKDDGAEAITFLKPGRLEDGRLSGYPFTWSPGGLPLLLDAPGVVECELRGLVELGDHHTVLGEVTEAQMRLPQAGRPDGMILHLSDLGPTVFYGG